MASNDPNVIRWFLNDFENIWNDQIERDNILRLEYNTLLNILSSEDLNVKNEYIVWKVIYDWVTFDKGNRLEHLPELISNCLRFGRLDEHFIKLFIFECDLFMNLTDAAQLVVKNLIIDTFQNSSQTTNYSFNLSNLNNGIYLCERRKPLLACISFNGSIKLFDYHYNNWHSSPVPIQLPNRQYSYQLVLLGNMLYALGGNINNVILNSFLSHNLSDPLSQWTTKANMNQSRKSFCSVVLNNFIYVIGGQNQNDSLLYSCERNNIQQSGWSRVADMNRARAFTSAAVINGCIYVAGGFSEHRWLKFPETLCSVEKYNINSGTWKEVAPMTTARRSLTLTSFAGRLWAIGGEDAQLKTISSVESYDPVTDTWREEAPLKEGRSNHAAIEYNGELYVVGGFIRYGASSRLVQKYTVGQGWTEMLQTENRSFNPQLIIVPRDYKPFFT